MFALQLYEVYLNIRLNRQSAITINNAIHEKSTPKL